MQRSEICQNCVFRRRKRLQRLKIGLYDGSAFIAQKKEVYKKTDAVSGMMVIKGTTAMCY